MKTNLRHDGRLYSTHTIYNVFLFKGTRQNKT